MESSAETDTHNGLMVQDPDYTTGALKFLLQMFLIFAIRLWFAIVIYIGRFFNGLLAI